MTDLNRLLNQTEQAVREAAALMTQAFTAEEKGSAVNIVTSADLAVQKFLEQRLTSLLPGSAFFGEEGQASDGSTQYLWVVDPIDGTMNFSRGLGECGISAALLEEERPVLGVVFNPYKDELYAAARGMGAKRNGCPIRVSGRSFAEGLYCTALSTYRKEFAPRCLKVLEEVHGKCNDFRRFGTCAMELCYLAAGQCELYFEYRVFPWDFAAAALILTEAGGLICSPEGKPLPHDRATPVIAANSRENLRELLAIVNKHIPDFEYEEILR